MINVLPIATTILAALLSIEPLHLEGYAALTPAFTLIATYHWTIYRPNLLPAPWLFLIGMIQDLLSGGLPGVLYSPSGIILLTGPSRSSGPASPC